MNNQKEIQSSVTSTGLTRVTGVSAILGGILYAGIQLIHPADHISSVDTGLWVIVACLSMAMSLFILIGITGIYTTQANEAGWLGLVGYVLFGLFWIASIAFSFIEAFVLPLLIADAPGFVAGFVGIFGGAESEVRLGVLPALAPIAGALYLLGGLLLGIAMFRAAVLPRPTAALLAFGAVVTLAAAVIPHPADRILAVPMGLALIWLGYVLLSERK